MPKFRKPRVDLTGRRFGKLVVLGLFPSPKVGIRQWLCQCDCGNQTFSWSSNLTSGIKQSCGCYARQRTSETKKTHGMRRTALYNIWCNMLARCQNPNSIGWSYYGGRGIKVCDLWKCFENFYADVGERPVGKSLDRIDVNGDYTPENCRWSSNREQSRNKRNNQFITWGGKTMILKDWALYFNIPYSTLHRRVRVLGWDVDRAFTTTVRGK